MCSSLVDDNFERSGGLRTGYCHSSVSFCVMHDKDVRSIGHECIWELLVIARCKPLEMNLQRCARQCGRCGAARSSEMESRTLGPEACYFHSVCFSCQAKG